MRVGALVMLWAVVEGGEVGLFCWMLGRELVGGWFKRI